MKQEIKKTETKTKINIRTATKFNINPFMDNMIIQTRKQRLTVARGSKITDENGEEHCTEIAQIREVDSAEFVKLFTANLKAFFDLSQSGFRVLQYILRVVQQHPGTDKIYLSHGNALKQEQQTMSKATFSRGFAELIEKQFVALSSDPFMYFINPNLFFNGDRARFVVEYRKQKQKKTNSEYLEDLGQQRLIQ